jgi:hypothetical protein
MVRIQLTNGEFLQLFPKSRIVWKMRNPILIENVLPLTYSLPFKIPMKDSANAVNLNYPFHPQIKRSTLQYDVVIWFADSRPRKAILTISEANEEFAEVTITVDKSIENLADQSIRTVLADIIGAEVASPVAQQVDIQVVGNPMFYPGYIAAGKLVRIKINDSEFSTPATSVLTFVNANVMYTALVNQINTAAIGVTASVEGVDAATIRIRIVNNTPGINNLFQLDLQTILDEYRDGDHAWYWKVYEEESWIATHISQVVTMVGGVNGGNFIFPPVKNSRFSPDENYPGYQNILYNFNLEEKDTLVGFITPFPRLSYVLTEVMKAIGYTVTNNYISTGEFSKIYLYSNVSADFYTKAYGTVVIGPLGGFDLIYDFDKEVNIHVNQLNLGRYLPDVKVREFLTAIKSLFNLEYKYNPQRGEVEIIPARLKRGDLIATAPDVTQHAILPLNFTNPDKEISTIRSLAFKVDTADELQQDLQDWQQPIILNANGNKDVTVEVSSLRDVIDGVPYPLVLNLDMTVPHLQAEIVGIFNNSGSPAALRLCHYRGVMPVSNTPVATSRTLFWPPVPAGSLSLTWHGPDGLYERFWKNFVELRNDRPMMRNAMTYPPEIIGNLEDHPAQFINGSLYIWKECDHESRETGADISKMLWIVM